MVFDSTPSGAASAWTTTGIRRPPSMPIPVRPLAFITASTDHGTLIVNRFDQHAGAGGSFGVGYQLLGQASYDWQEVILLRTLLDLRRKHYGDGVVAIDCGANLGVHTIEWSKHMTGWGRVLAFEAQERIYYALAGNIAINNCFNARAINAAVSSQTGTMKIPQPNYLANASFGSLELRKQDRTEFIGQVINYSEDAMIDVPMLHLDSFNFPRLDLIKIDVEGMELDVLAGAAKCIAERQPILYVEALKTDQNALRGWLERAGYSIFPVGMNFLALHKNDKGLENVKFTPSASSAT
jgi:FkbM family methyltransferase